jgi:hypothetical protein
MPFPLVLNLSVVIAGLDARKSDVSDLRSRLTCGGRVNPTSDAIHRTNTMDARDRRQVYAVCASLTALPAHAGREWCQFIGDRIIAYPGKMPALGLDPRVDADIGALNHANRNHPICVVFRKGYARTCESRAESESHPNGTHSNEGCESQNKTSHRSGFCCASATFDCEARQCPLGQHSCPPSPSVASGVKVRNIVTARDVESDIGSSWRVE